jgi:hypothetical protein
VLRGEGEIATVDPHPGKVLMDGGPGLGVISHLLQGLLGESLDAAHVKPTDGCQAEVDAGAVTTRARHGDRLFQRRRRAGRVAGVEVVLGCRHAPSREPCALLGRCQLPGQLQQLCGRVRGSPGARVPARLLQRPAHVQVGTAGREGKMPRPLLRVVDELRQAAMHASPGVGRGLGVDGGAQQRVGEPEPAVGSLQDARLLGAPHAGRCPVPSSRDRKDQILCGAGRGRHDEEPSSGARRQCGKPGTQQLLEILRNWEWFAGRWPDPPPGEGPSDLEGNERVSFRDPVQPQQDGVRQPPSVRSRRRRVIASSCNGPMGTRWRGTGPD